MLIDFACVGNWTVADKYFLEKMVSKMRYENMNRRLLGREEGTVFANYIYFGYPLLCNKSPQLLVVQNNSIFFMVRNSLDQKLRQGMVGRNYFYSIISGSSSGKAQLAGVA